MKYYSVKISILNTCSPAVMTYGCYAAESEEDCARQVGEQYFPARILGMEDIPEVMYLEYCREQEERKRGEDRLTRLNQILDRAGRAKNPRDFNPQ